MSSYKRPADDELTKEMKINPCDFDPTLTIDYKKADLAFKGKTDKFNEIFDRGYENTLKPLAKRVADAINNCDWTVFKDLDKELRGYTCFIGALPCRMTSINLCETIIH